MWLKSILLYIVQLGFLIHLIFAGEVGDECMTEKSLVGSCVFLTDCAVAVRDVNRMDFHKLKRCGFDGLLEIVCCPKDVNSTPASNTTRNDDNMSKKKQPRVADRECQKIIESSQVPMDLHIIGGINASQGEFPHMVSLGYKNEGTYDFLCGGSVISDKFILTAAHCVETINYIMPSIVRMGVTDIGGRTFNETSDIHISEIIKHPNYTRNTKYHDIALIRLTKPMNFSTTLNAICLYTADKDPTVTLTVTGWGKISTKKDVTSNVLLKAMISVVDTETCNGSYKWRKLPQGIINKQICAGDLKGRHDTCQGDSGGPLQGLTEKDGNWRLVGVTSFGRGCGLTVPGVYTRISQYLDWIESVVWPN